MTVHWQPVGPLPPATYWRRRLVVSVLAVVLLWLAVIGLTGGDGDDVLTAPPAATPVPTSSTSPSPAVAPSPATAACTDDALEVTATADAPEYPVGGRAVLGLSVRNTSSQACLRSVGQGAVELIVTSGTDRIWSSDDCAPGGDDGEILLEPGAEQTARATWSTTRSAPGCPAEQPSVKPGTYRVTARVGELLAPGATFTVTG